MRETLDILVALIKRFEGCKLTAYPDPGTGGAPWTIGYGETLGVKQGDVWAQEKADYVLRQRAGQFMLAAMARCPALYLETPERIIACTSLAYNIGVGAFGASSISRKTMRHDFIGAANAFLLWNKAGGKIMRGLTNRRQAERMIYLNQ